MPEIQIERREEQGKLRIYIGAAPGGGQDLRHDQRRLSDEDPGRHRRCDRAGGGARPQGD